ncbi:unnamed protein product, partial [Pleuronectes platessa]
MGIHCSTHCDVPTTLAGDLNNGPLANDVSAPSPPLHQVESHLINKDVLVKHMSCVMLLDQHENASYSMDTERQRNRKLIRRPRQRLFFSTISKTTVPPLFITVEERRHPVEEQDESAPIRPSRRRCNRGTSATELERPRSFTGLPEYPHDTRMQHREGH